MSGICVFFGHRNAYDVNAVLLAQTIEMAIEQYGITEFWCGGYGAFDSLTYATVCKIQEQHPHIRIYKVLAYMPGERSKLTEVTVDTIYPEGLESVPKRFAISRRNDYMVDNCTVLIAYVKNHFGGAYKAYTRAIRKGKTVINIAEEETNGNPVL